MEFKKLKVSKVKTGGRNNLGRITSFHRGGGHKSKRMVLDFKRAFEGIPGKILKIEKDSSRTGFVGLVYYLNGYLSYQLLSDGLEVGDYIVAGDFYKDLSIQRVGCSLPLDKVSIGEAVSNIELFPGKGGSLARAGGTKGFVIKKGVKNKYVMVKLPSGEVRLLLKNCLASVGGVSNKEHRFNKLKKAGQSRWRGRRPVVRGVAMNPVDHPHGGGEGKTSGGRCSVTPWGRLTKGQPTRKVKKSSSLIVRRRK